MKKTPLACIILAAGQGRRMNSAQPKALHKLAGRPLIGWLLESVDALHPLKTIVVVAPDCGGLAEHLGDVEIVVQKNPLGTGDAVKAALPALGGFEGDVLILLADTPLVSSATLRRLIEIRHCDAKTGLSVLGAEFENPAGYGRLVLGPGDGLERIVEDKDATAAEHKIKTCNAGVFCVDGSRLAGWVNRIGNKNAQKEYYITDLVTLAAAEGVRAHAYITADAGEVRGVNSRGELAMLELELQNNLRRAAMAEGATLTDPDTVHFSWDTKLGRDVVVEPGVFFGPGVTVADNVHIKAYSYIEGTEIGAGALIGPFARLRPGTAIGDEARIGNFVEVKNAIIGPGAKANHLSYIGDAEIGADVNFSCGAITANYDGVNKNRTIVGAGAMIGCNVNLVAPVEIGGGAYVAAGSTITKNVPADALAVAREKPFIKEGWAAQKLKGKKTGGQKAAGKKS